MKNVKYLLPSYFKIIGLLMLPVMLYLGFRSFVGSVWGNIFASFMRKINGSSYPGWMEPYAAMFRNDSWSDELIILGVTVSFAFMVFSREKVEDEYIWKIRMDSLVGALITDTVLIIIAIFLLFKMNFLLFMGLNYYIIAILYLIIFRISVYRSNKQFER